MSNDLSRRQILKTAGGLAAGAAAAATLGKFARTSFAHMGPGIRPHGVILTFASMQQLQECIRLGGYDILKVVSTNDWGIIPDRWTTNNIQKACNLTPYTIVRTKTGDGYRTGLDPNQVVSEIRPWYAVKNNIFIEIGNEPNEPGGWNDNDIWVWRYYLNASIDACRREFPRAKLISPGLSGNNPRPWFEIAHDVMKRCDYIGFHAYAFTDWGDPNNPNSKSKPDLEKIIPFMQQFFRSQSWALTEYGINAPEVSRYEKGRRYANFLHKGRSNPVLPSNVWGATYYHLDVSAQQGTDNYRYHIYPEGDTGYKSITG